MNDEITYLQNDRKDLVNSYMELHTMPNRMQSSVIPIISKALSYFVCDCYWVRVKNNMGQCSQIRNS